MGWHADWYKNNPEAAMAEISTGSGYLTDS